MRQKIESAANRRLSITRRLGTRHGVLKHSLFLMEGPRYISDYLATARPEWLVMSDEAESRVTSIADRAVESGSDVLEVPAKLFSGLSDTIHSQGLIAVCPLPDIEAAGIATKGLILLLDSISDPGNMGTLIRSAAAFGCAAVLAGQGSCCPFIPKVTRAATGLNTRISILFDIDLSAWINEQENGFPVIGAEAVGEQIETFSPPESFALVIGSEAHGISPVIREMLTTSVSIPMKKGIESLNAAVSGSILLYALTKCTI